MFTICFHLFFDYLVRREIGAITQWIDWSNWRKMRLDFSLHPKKNYCLLYIASLLIMACLLYI